MATNKERGDFNVCVWLFDNTFLILKSHALNFIPTAKNEKETTTAAGEEEETTTKEINNTNMN